MNIDISGALLTSQTQYEYTQIQCGEGASEVNIDYKTPIILFYDKQKSYKVGRVFLMAVVSILLLAKFGGNDHRVDATHFS